MGNKEKPLIEKASNNQEVTPLILDFVERREGAVGGTTSGTWADVDGADTD